MSNVQTPDVLQQIQNLCTKLAANGDETLFMSVNIRDNKCAYLGSVNGKKYVEKKELVPGFYLYCNEKNSGASENAKPDESQKHYQKGNNQKASSLPNASRSLLSPNLKEYMKNQLQATRKLVTSSEIIVGLNSGESGSQNENDSIFSQTLEPVVFNESELEPKVPVKETHVLVEKEGLKSSVENPCQSNEMAKKCNIKSPLQENTDNTVQNEDMSASDICNGRTSKETVVILAKQPGNTNLSNDNFETKESTGNKLVCPIKKKSKSLIEIDVKSKSFLTSPLHETSTPHNKSSARMSTRSGGKVRPFAWLKKEYDDNASPLSRLESKKRHLAENGGDSNFNHIKRKIDNKTKCISFDGSLELKESGVLNKQRKEGDINYDSDTSNNLVIIKGGSKKSKEILLKISAENTKIVLTSNSEKQSNTNDVCIEVCEKNVGEDERDDHENVECDDGSDENGESGENFSLGSDYDEKMKEKISDVENDFSEKKPGICLIYTCKACEFVVKSKKLLQEHYRMSHFRKFFCSVPRCYSAFCSEEELNGHTQSDHTLDQSSTDLEHLSIVAAAAECLQEEVVHMTDRCSDDSQNMQEVKRQGEVKGQVVEVQSESEKDMCNMINEHELLNQEVQSREMSTDVEQKDMHPEISEVKGQANAINSEQKVKTKKVKYECAHCGRLFPDKTKVRLHVEKYREYKAHQCETCGECFRMACTLWRHRRVHNYMELYACEHCDRKFRTFDGYKSHIIADHSEHILSKWKVFTCQFCNKAFGAKSSYKRHLSVHTGYKPCICDQCGRNFSCLSALNAHKKLHEGEKKHVCHICNQSFLILSKIKRHIQTYKHQQMCAAIGIDPDGNLKEVEERIESMGKLRTHPGRISIPPAGEVIPVTQKDLEQLRAKLKLDQLDEQAEGGGEQLEGEAIQCVFIHLPEEITKEENSQNEIVYSLAEDGSLLKVE